MLKNPLFNKSTYCRYKTLEESSASSKSSVSSSHSSQSSSRSSYSSSRSSDSSNSSISSGYRSSSHNAVNDLLAYRFGTIPVNINSNSENENPSHECPNYESNILFKYLWNKAYSDNYITIIQYMSVFDSIPLGNYIASLSACGMNTSGVFKNYDFGLNFKIEVVRTNGVMTEYKKIVTSDNISINITSQNIKLIKMSASFSKVEASGNIVSSSSPFAYNVRNNFSEILDISPDITI